MTWLLLGAQPAYRRLLMARRQSFWVACLFDIGFPGEGGVEYIAMLSGWWVPDGRIAPSIQTEMRRAFIGGLIRRALHWRAIHTVA